MSENARLSAALTVLSACLFLLLWSAAPASAEVNPTWFEELSTVQQHATTDFFYEQSPQGIVPYAGEANEISAQVSQAYEAQTDVEPFYGEVSTGTATVEEDAALIPEVTDVVPELAAAGGAFALGWKIGEGLNAVFADIGLGGGSAPDPLGLISEMCVSEACGGSLKYRPYGWDIYAGATVQQSPGAYLYGGVWLFEGESRGSFNTIRWDQDGCEFSGFVPPPYSNLEQAVPSNASCSGTPTTITYPFVMPGQLFSRQTMHHYDELTDGPPDLATKAPPDPGTASVEASVASSLDESEFMQSFVGEAEDPDPESAEFPDPHITTKKIDDEKRRCDRGTAMFDDVGGNSAPEPFAKRETAPFSIASLPPGVVEEAPVYLRWGTTSWLPAKTGFEGTRHMDDWGGWGYRHIRAKHGWNALDRFETETALEQVQSPVSLGLGKYLYSGIDEALGIESVECERKVVVQFEAGEDPASNQLDPLPRGIVSSYNVVR